MCSGWVKGCDRWVWVVGSGRRRSGSGSGFGSGQVQQLWVSSENSWEFFFGISLSLPDIHLPAEIARFRQYEADAAGIFSGTKQEGYLYRCTGRYSTELTSLIYIHVHIAQEIVRSHYPTCNTYVKSNITSKMYKTHIFII